MNERSHRLAARLRQAVSDDAIEIHYQPVIDLVDGGTVRMEALARWPAAGPLVGPDQFVRAAELSGWVDEFDLHVLGLVARQVSIWSSAGLDPVVSVNVSTFTLRDDRNLRHALDILDRFGVHPRSVHLEVTETTRNEFPMVTSVLARFRAAGFRVSLDDFGTHRSLFDQLRNSEADELKIDREFIGGLSQPRVRTIIGSIIDLAHALEVDVVAEGVETAEEMISLVSLGCDLAQGYLFSVPVEAHAAFELFERVYDVHSGADHS